MGVHSIIVFDRRGKTLFTKRYTKKESLNNSSTTTQQQLQQQLQEEEEQQSEMRKLVFGMLFSLREMVGSLAPESDLKDTGKF
jgi:trafficking protein particle complex subunit 1